MEAKKKKEIVILIFLIFFLITINYSFIDKALEEFLNDYEIGIVERVIDGDTVVINKTSVRLLGINSPEKGKFYYNESKEFLEDFILNKEVRLEFGKEKYDRYNRTLAYIYLKDKNVNLELVKEGFANFYFPSGKDMHYENFKKAWEKCVEDNKNLCEKSTRKCVDCIELKEFNYKNEILIFNNKCDFNCELTGWEIKDEGRKNFVFNYFILKTKNDLTIKVGYGEDTETTLFWKKQKYVWTKTGDSLFLRDKEGGLVLWRGY